MDNISERKNDCKCGKKEWTEIYAMNIVEFGTVSVDWCKNCGTVRKKVRSNTGNEAIIDHRKPAE